MSERFSNRSLPLPLLSIHVQILGCRYADEVMLKTPAGPLVQSLFRSLFQVLVKAELCFTSKAFRASLDLVLNDKAARNTILLITTVDYAEGKKKPGLKSASVKIA